jgi:hypothetical protein
LLGGLVGFLFFAWRSRRRITANRAKWAALAIAVILAIAATYADMGALGTRLEGSFSEGVPGRLAIWRQTWPVVRDFWPWGTGAGTYQQVMVQYQTMSRLYYITHADNEIPSSPRRGRSVDRDTGRDDARCGRSAGGQRLREDHTAAFWLRLGAATGMLAVAAQNMAEMTLRIPANAVLFAVLAAIAMHDRTSLPPATPPRHGRE